MNSTMPRGSNFFRFATLQTLPRRHRRVWLTGAGVTAAVILLRLTGLLQPAEFALLDLFFRLRPLSPPDDRIVIVSIDDTDINQAQAWPLSDAVMASLLLKIRAQQPRAIGLNVYRDLPVSPGQAALQQVYETTPNLIGIEKIADRSGGVAPPALLAQRNQVAFNNILLDGDGTVRRAMLYWTLEDGRVSTSLALALALRFLRAEGVTPTSAAVNSAYLQLDRGVFRPFQANDGGYVRSDAGGYQILANFHRTTAGFRTVAMRDVLADRVSPNLFRDRLVLVGSTATSLKDNFYTPLSGGLFHSANPVSGVELHANFIRQILDAALIERPMLRTWSDLWEMVWVLGWAWAGAGLSWGMRSPGRSSLSSLFAAASLVLVCYLAFLGGWWLPVVPPLLAMSVSSLAIANYLAYLQAELGKSKEFLSSIINAIPDPIFVKDHQHRWIVLNDAYCRLIGYPLEALLDKTDSDFFPAAQARALWKEDALTFESGVERESEEEFVAANGATYLVATKRSLHRDSAGNLFLVGVIRDITQRKQIEEELRRTAKDLKRSNEELQQAGNLLRRMAYYDPLTGLPNRKLLQDRLEQAIEQAREHGQFVALLFLDLDGFKQINDSYGHMVGDLLLKAVAQRLLGCLRMSDTVARLGGDEFVVLLTAIPSVQDVAKVADKILSTLSQSFILEGATLWVSTSVGVSVYPFHGMTGDLLLTQADLAMYRAKQQGKNRCQFAHARELSNS